MTDYKKTLNLPDTPFPMLDTASELRAEWIAGKECIGVTAGASAPEVLVRAVVEKLVDLGATAVRELDGVTERVTFPLPKALATARS